MTRISVWILGASLLLPGAVQALDIPLAGAGPSGAGGGVKIGYVDMERIFQIYPQTLAAKDDYAKQLQKKRQQLADKEDELAGIKSRISVLESTLKTMGGQSSPAPIISTGATVPSTAGGAGDSQALLNMKKELEDKQAEYEDLRKTASDDLVAFQNKQSQMILGKIYQALRELASDEQITLVVDKSSILYGSADVDLTEKLQERVRGY